MRISFLNLIFSANFNFKPMELINRDMTFFANCDENKNERGITSTAATHLSELATEIIAGCKAKLEAASFVNGFVDIVGSANEKGKQVEIGYATHQLAEFNALVGRVADMHSFCAWMREAVKAKERMMEEVSNVTLNDWAEANNIIVPKMPARDAELTEQDIIKTLSVAERCEYYALEAKAAAYGKFIHPDEPFSVARRRLQEIMSKPITTQGEGSSLLIYRYENSVDEEDVEKVYLQLQSEHRDAENRLNQIKTSIKKKLNLAKAEQTEAYKNKIDAYMSESNKLNADFSSWQRREIEQISSLKIIVPNNLQATFDYLSALDEK